VRITVKAENEGSASVMLDAEERKIRNILDDTIFGVDDETMESVVLDALRQHGLTLAVAEITSGGIISARLTASDTTGAVFRGSVVPLAGAVRETVLGVPPDAIGTAEAAAAMAGAVRETFGADIGIATTGAHDPRSPGDLPPGTTFLGIATATGTDVKQVRLPGDRERVRQFAVISLLNYLRLKLLT
jgi:PncC family amidohydrolase